jgi:hypothetical protein
MTNNTNCPDLLNLAGIPMANTSQEEALNNQIKQCAIDPNVVYVHQKNYAKLANKILNKAAKLTYKTVDKEGYSIIFPTIYKTKYQNIFLNHKILQKVALKAYRLHNLDNPITKRKNINKKKCINNLLSK